jgi:hypothetical protein
MLEYLSFLLVALAGMFNATMDVLRYRYNKSIFSNWRAQWWINPSISWRNKWKPKSKLGDFLFSTVLVWVTDMWHFVKMLMLTSMCFAISLHHIHTNILLDAIILYFIFTSIFELFFSFVLIKKD